jgi:hypothetical protein
MECTTALTGYLVDDVLGRNKTCLRICNTENVVNKLVGFSLRRRDQLKIDVVWGLLGKVIQGNARFGLTDRLEIHVDHVRMLAANGRVRTKGRSLYMSAFKRSILTVTAPLNCLPYALIAIRVNDDPNYQPYR